MPMQTGDKINLCNLLFTAFISAAVAFISWRLQQQSDNLARETGTTLAMADVNRRIADILALKIKRDTANGKGPAQWFDYEYIRTDTEVEGLVFQLLNEYDYVCLASNRGVFSREIVEKIRGDALRRTWESYNSYIANYRKAQNPDAWKECDDWVANTSS